jgi:predicted porin
MSQQRATIHKNCKAAAFALAACAGTAISVPAAALDLSIYGVGHLSGDKIDTGTSSSSYLHSNSSRLGFKGSHDLGNGLSILAQYESGVDLTGNGTGDGNGGANSNGQIFTRARDSFVGVRGGFGTVQLGRLPALNQWVYDYNLFADQVGDLGNIWGGGSLPGRADHAAYYRTPDFGGFGLGLTYVPTQGGTNTSAYIAKGDYAKGGLKLGVAYGNFNDGGAVGAADNKAAAVTASYDFGAFNLGGGWQRETGIGNVSGADRNNYTLGAAVKAGSNGTVKAQYARAGDLGSTPSSSAKQWALGYDHAWDKNTTLYVAYAKTQNDANAKYTSYDYGHGDQGVPDLVAGNSPRVISVGVVYKFDLGILPR